VQFQFVRPRVCVLLTVIVLHCVLAQLRQVLLGTKAPTCVIIRASFLLLRDKVIVRRFSCDKAIVPRFSCGEAIVRRFSGDKAIVRTFSCGQAIVRRCSCDESIVRRFSDDKAIVRRFPYDKAIVRRFSWDKATGRTASCSEIWCVNDRNFSACTPMCCTVLYSQQQQQFRVLL